MDSVSVTTAGESVTANYALTPPLPELPEVTYASLNPAAGEDLSTTVARITTPARLVLPAGKFKASGNSNFGYSIFSKKLLGIRGTLVDGEIATEVDVMPNTWKTQVNPPASAGNGLLRFGPNDANVPAQVTTLSDIRFVGADQVAADGTTLMNRAGLIDYWGRGSVWDNVEVFGVSRGSGSTPDTGETFSINVLRSNGSTFRNIHSDGRLNGNRVGGSPFGINGARNITVEDSVFEYSLVSGVTVSHSGSGSSLTPSYDIAFRRNIIRYNANTVMAAGKRFSGINAENWLGTNVIENNNIFVDAYEWNSAHFTVGASHPDGATTTFTYRDNIVNDVGYQGRNKGALVIRLPYTYAGVTNTITLDNIYVIQGGVRLTPRVISSAPPANWDIDPTKEYILIR